MTDDIRCATCALLHKEMPPDRPAHYYECRAKIDMPVMPQTDMGRALVREAVAKAMQPPNNWLTPGVVEGTMTGNDTVAGRNCPLWKVKK